MASFLMAVVASIKRVSVGAILWKTTLEMEDLPLLCLMELVLQFWFGRSLGLCGRAFSDPSGGGAACVRLIW